MSYKSNSHEHLLGDHHVPTPDEIGFLVLNENGVILNGGGQLARDEKTAKIFLNIHHQLLLFGDNGQVNTSQSVDITSFETITVQFDEHFYSMVRGPKRLLIVKRKLGAVIT